MDYAWIAVENLANPFPASRPAPMLVTVMTKRRTGLVVVLAFVALGLPSVGTASESTAFSDFVPRTAASHQTSVTIGLQPWAVLLCRFADISDTPEQPSFFEQLFSAAFPGLGDYWSEVSLGKMSLTGTEVFGWYDMDGAYSWG